MTLDDLEWVPLASHSSDPSGWQAKVYLLDDMLRIYARADGLYDIMMGMPGDNGDDDCWYRLDALTAQCVLIELTQGGNDDAG